MKRNKFIYLLAFLAVMFWGLALNCQTRITSRISRPQ